MSPKEPRSPCSRRRGAAVRATKIQAEALPWGKERPRFPSARSSRSQYCGTAGCARRRRTCRPTLRTRKSVRCRDQLLRQLASGRRPPPACGGSHLGVERDSPHSNKEPEPDCARLPSTTTRLCELLLLHCEYPC